MGTTEATKPSHAAGLEQFNREAARAPLLTRGLATLAWAAVFAAASNFLTTRVAVGAGSCSVSIPG